METFWDVVYIILACIYGVLIGYTMTTVWAINRRTKSIQELQKLTALKGVLDDCLEDLEAEFLIKEDEDAGKKKSVKKTTKKTNKKKGTK